PRALSARRRTARRCHRGAVVEPRLAHTAHDAERGNREQRRAGHSAPAQGARSAAAALLLALPQTAPRALRPLPVLRRSAVEFVEGALDGVSWYWHDLDERHTGGVERRDDSHRVARDPLRHRRVRGCALLCDA